MKLEALKNQGARSDLTCGQIGHKLNGAKARDIVADESGDNARNVQRLIRLTNLVPELLDMVDEKKIAFNPAVELSYLDESQQRDFLEAMNDTQNAPSFPKRSGSKGWRRKGTSRMTLLLPSWEKRKRTSWTRWSSKTTPCGNTFPAATPRNRWRTPSSSCWISGNVNSSGRMNADTPFERKTRPGLSFLQKFGGNPL